MPPSVPRRLIRLAPCLGALVLLVGCASAGDDPIGDATDSLALDAVGAAEDACAHPFPCDVVWPATASGPFGVAEILRVRVPMDDGVEVDGWVALPSLPQGVRAPVALHSTPYLGFCPVNPYWGPGPCDATPDDPAFWSEAPPASALSAWGVPPIELVRRGYAAAFFNIRGTGNSGGCFDMFGPTERRDQRTLVEYLAAQPWSNGRVAMGGGSHPGTTPLMAAAEQAPSLKTVVILGMVSDYYTYLGTPQGAVRTIHPTFSTFLAASDTFVPPLGGGVEHGTIHHAPYVPERLCPEVAESLAEHYEAHFTDSRDAGFFDDRRLIDRLGETRTSMFLVHGFQDNATVAYQENLLWKAMKRAPKRVLEGQWGHRWPNAFPHGGTWSNTLFPWLDYWLKGVGPRPGIGRVDYQDGGGDWHEDKAWPPAASRDEVLYLQPASRALAGSPAEGTGSFVAAPDPLNNHQGLTYLGVPAAHYDALCHDWALGSTLSEPRSLVFYSAPMQEEALVAGNPFAYLRLSSDMPGGMVAVHLVDLAPDFHCDAAGLPSGVTVLGSGVADLRFHQGNYVGADFPIGSEEMVRVDLFDFAQRVAPGHRLAAIVSFGELGFESTGQPYFPRVTVHGARDGLASQVVLPVVKGTLGGSRPASVYPPRPFSPAGH